MPDSPADTPSVGHTRRPRPPSILIGNVADSESPELHAGCAVDGSDEQKSEAREEDKVDNLGELSVLPSATGTGRHSPIPILSPRWQSMEEGSTPYSPIRPPSWHRNSLEVPSFYAPPSPQLAGRPARDSHGRNLSIHFPHPEDLPLRPKSWEEAEQAAESVIPSASDKRAFGGPTDWKFGAQAPATDQPTSDLNDGPNRGKRRGHHHKHSLSHNFFSFLDQPSAQMGENSETADVPPGDKSVEASRAPPPDAPTPVPMPSLSAASPNTLSPLPPSKTDRQRQLLVAIAVVEGILGAGLWVEGQISGWRSLAGAGYLVTFDALGLVVNILSRRDEERWGTLRRPYGSTRVTALMYFAQSLFLMFAALYIAKEAIEGVILGSGAHDHGMSGHHHGDHSGGAERPFPHVLLLLSTCTSLIAGTVLDNHRGIVEATGPLFLPPWYLQLATVKVYDVLANPYTLSITATTVALLLGPLVTPPPSLHSFDFSASLILAVVTGALAYPPTFAFGDVLLQTAPPPTTSQMRALRRALREVSNDRRVLGLGTMRCWAISAGHIEMEDVQHSAPSSRRGSFSSLSGRPALRARSMSQMSASSIDIPLAALVASPLAPGAGLSSRSPEAHVPLVVTLVVHVHPDADDTDVLKVTKSTWTLVSEAVATRLGGEVSVTVERGWDSA